jgi:hypothetical protein
MEGARGVRKNFQEKIPRHQFSPLELSIQEMFFVNDQVSGAIHSGLWSSVAASLL